MKYSSFKKRVLFCRSSIENNVFGLILVLGFFLPKILKDSIFAKGRGRLSGALLWMEGHVFKCGHDKILGIDQTTWKLLTCLFSVQLLSLQLSCDDTTLFDRVFQFFVLELLYNLEWEIFTTNLWIYPLGLHLLSADAWNIYRQSIIDF